MTLCRLTVLASRMGSSFLSEVDDTLKARSCATLILSNWLPASALAPAQRVCALAGSTTSSWIDFQCSHGPDLIGSVQMEMEIAGDIC
jgi:hypothetical protein